jgi:hypothetical protein
VLIVSLAIFAQGALAAGSVEISTSFGASSVPLRGSTSLKFTIFNTSKSLAVAGVGFKDALPSGLVVSSPSVLNDACEGHPSAVPGSSEVSLSEASLPPGVVCFLTVNVRAIASGVQTNSVTVTSEAGTGNTSIGSITVQSLPPILEAGCSGSTGDPISLADAIA